MMRKSLLAVLVVLFLFTSCSDTSSVVDVEEIKLDKESIEIAPGGTATIIATVLPDNATNKEISWNVTGEGVSITDGVITVSDTAAAGDYTITVTSSSNPDVKATCLLTVTEAPISGGGGGGGGGAGAPPEEEETVESTEVKLPEVTGELTKTEVSDPTQVENDDQMSFFQNLNLSNENTQAEA